MELLVRHLHKLIELNEQILRQVHEDEVTVASMNKAFNTREDHIQEMDKIVSNTKRDDLSDKELVLLKNLYDQLFQHENMIQKAFSHLIDKSQQKVGDAIKFRKAEEGYQLLK